LTSEKINAASSRFKSYYDNINAASQKADIANAIVKSIQDAIKQKLVSTLTNISNKTGLSQAIKNVFTSFFKNNQSNVSTQEVVETESKQKTEIANAIVKSIQDAIQNQFLLNQRRQQIEEDPKLQKIKELKSINFKFGGGLIVFNIEGKTPQLLGYHTITTQIEPQYQ
jgi:hypothetical protein